MFYYNRQTRSKPFENSRLVKSNILLVGMPACGKSTVGSILASFLGFGFLELDRAVGLGALRSPRLLARACGLD